MWKESLRIGIDLIDGQHKALFDKIEMLRKEVQSGSAGHKQNCIDAIAFLKDYTVRHFAEEEAYQQSIGYKYFDGHKKLHEGFIKTLLEHEKKLKESGYSDGEVKSFTGMLVAWLLYHVSDADQKIVRDEPVVGQADAQNDMVRYAFSDVLSKMAGYSAGGVKLAPPELAGDVSGGSVAVEVKLTGGASGQIVYTYTVPFIKGLINAMLGYEPQHVGELEVSALFEVSNIISGNVCRQISYGKGVTCDISTPFLACKPDHAPGERITVDTGHGIVGAALSILYE